MSDYIEVRGAKLHNLKNINVRIPRGKLVVITGPSGSGKSTLAFDTLYAEGQRRYVESLSAYARQFLEKMPRPEVETIQGISPAVAIQQKAPSGNPRSTVGTVTEIYDYLRLLFARIGELHCHQCREPIQKDHPEHVVRAISAYPLHTRYYIAFPFHIPDEKRIIPFREWVVNRGFLRLWQNGKILDLRDPHPVITAGEVWIIVDRGIRDHSIDSSRLIDSIETAFLEGDGHIALITSDGLRQNFSQDLVCRKCGTQSIEPQPRLFSFNNPFGACPGCQGFGDMTDLDIQKIIPDPGKSLRQEAILPWSMPAYQHLQSRLAAMASRHGISMEIPFRELPEEHQSVLINGTKDFTGIRGFFHKLERKKYKVHIRVFLSRFRSYFTCTICQGNRLRPEALAITIGGKNLADLVKLNIMDLQQFFQQLTLSPTRQKIADQLLKELNSRLQYLLDVGLDYLHLDRRASTLSGGEFQRINLATALGTALTDTLYVLDEPTIGLHPRDTARLVRILKSLSSIGNTTLVVEHERSVIENADYLIDLGPAAGENGGTVMYEGDFVSFKNFTGSLTAQYLRGEKMIHSKQQYRAGNGKAINIRGAQEHNLKNLDVHIPLGMMVAVTGVSGSGKSTLVHDVLYKGYLDSRGEARGRPGKFKEIRGLRNLSRVEMVDQLPIGRTPRSNPITYIKGFDEIRKLFSSLPRAKSHGLTPGHFSFNVPGGRCETCEGDGQLKIEMQFLADIYIQCETCRGKRYKNDILDIRLRGKNIYDVLEMTVLQALNFFAEHPAITAKIRVLQEVGLEYLKLGQSATTLSGGEAQRIKLAAHLNRKMFEDVLFLLDEPTTGLHFDDIAILIKAFDSLINRGASILVIEHNLEIIRNADWIIDLGPEGGNRGGYIVSEGTPLEVAQNPASHTGKFLKPILEN